MALTKSKTTVFGHPTECNDNNRYHQVRTIRKLYVFFYAEALLLPLNKYKPKINSNHFYGMCARVFFYLIWYLLFLFICNGIRLIDSNGTKDKQIKTWTCPPVVMSVVSTHTVPVYLTQFNLSKKTFKRNCGFFFWWHCASSYRRCFTRTEYIQSESI